MTDTITSNYRVLERPGDAGKGVVCQVVMIKRVAIFGGVQTVAVLANGP